MLEFTGERVVPGLVDPNLLNEHVARYRFAARFAAGAVVLDAGCGSGYGSAEFGNAAGVLGIDLSADAVKHAAAIFGGSNIRFLQAACEAFPFADGAFDLVVAFEVIEHLERWPDLLNEARRVLRPTGMLLVSTPNKAYYAESRAAAGPNPFHAHEFEYGEFKTALTAVFPHVRLWSQNHSEAIAFVPEAPSRGLLDAPGDPTPQNAHFFLAACSLSPIADPEAFAWLPEAGNVLREREQHIALLQAELRQKTEWLTRTGEDLAALQRSHEDLLAELHRQNDWADGLNAEIKSARERIGRLQEELKTTHAGYQERTAQLEEEIRMVHTGYQAQVAEFEQQDATRLAWVRDLESQIANGRRHIEHLNQKSESYYASLIEGQRKIESLQSELQRIEAENARLIDERHKIARSKWIRLGRTLGLGPIVKSD